METKQNVLKIHEKDNVIVALTDLKKGDKIYVEGKIKTRKWQSEDGIQRYSTEIHVVEFNFLSTKNDSNSNPNLSEDKSLQTKDESDENNSNDLPF